MTLAVREATNDDAGAVTQLVFDVLAEYGLRPDPVSTDSDVNDLEGTYTRAGGTFRVIVTEDGTIVGCGGMFQVDDDEMELRKMYLLPPYRGQGIGKQLLVDLIDFARQRNAKLISLETAGVLEEAIALYTGFGFKKSTRPNATGRCDQVWELTLANR